LSAVQIIVEDILSKRHDLSEEKVFALIEEKKKEGRGLLSDEGAARLVAEELLIQTRGTELGRMQLRDLVSGLNDVTVSGRVLMTWPPQTFQRRDGTPGRVLRLVLVDRSSRASCAFWDRHVDVISRKGNLQGKVVRIGHAYTRQGLSGETEVHAGERSSIDVDPPDLPSADFPEFKELFTPLGKLVVDVNQVNVVGFVQIDPRSYSFTKEDRTGSVLRAIIADDSGSVPLVAWNERAEELKELKKGEILQVVNARTRQNQNGAVELHTEKRSQIIVLTSAPEYLKPPTRRIYKVASLTPQVASADLNVLVLAKSLPREVKRSTGEGVKVSSILIADETGIASLSLWDDKADLVNQVSEGDSIEVRGVAIRDRLGELRLSLGRSGELQKLSEQVSYPLKVTKLNTLDSAKGLLTVEGTVSDEPLIRQVATEKGETVDVASFSLRDDVGLAKVTLWREQAAAAAKLRPGKKLRIVGVSVRPGFTGQLELTALPFTKISTLDQSVSDRPAWEDIRHVIALEPGLTTWVKGMVLDTVGELSLIAHCETCNGELKVSEKSFLCGHCNSKKSGKLGLSGRLKIDDGTGVAEVTLRSQDPTNLIAVDHQQILGRMLNEEGTTINVSREELADLMGKEIELYGTAVKDGQAKLVFDANKVIVVPKL
jgi:replication factor A1